MRKKLIYILLGLSFAFGCEDEKSDLPSVEDRTEAAIEDLRDHLTDPTNGWKVSYQPTSESGSFFMIMDFSENGDVNIQSDLAADDGVYFNQTTSYRIDSGLGLELIFETYGALHYLFELDQASFGAEFEWLYEGEDDDKLTFSSKSDLFDQSTIIFEPATSTDVLLFSREIAENFDSYAGQSPRLFGGANPSQQLYLSNIDLSVFWSVDLSKRILNIDLAGKGSTIQEVIAGNYQAIGQASGYTFLDGKFVLNNPVTINTGGQSFLLSEIILEEYSTNGDPLCAGSGENTPSYTISVAEVGSGTLTKNLINSSGFGFTAQSQSLYSVNIPFIFDDSLRSLAEEGSISTKLPNAVAFLMTLGFDSDSIPENSVGFLVEYDNDTTEYHLRSFDANLVGNLLEISLLDEYYHTGNPPAGEQQALMEITDEVFEGGSVYAYDLAIRGLTAFQFYNPCNGYEFILVR
ncbi:MAG: DUF4302 domain-containing protein [Marinoscillum sp.]